MSDLRNNAGFALIEILIATVILTIGSLGVASLTVSIMSGNSLSNRTTTATILAQNQMENIKNFGFAGTPAAGTTPLTENYNSISMTVGDTSTNYPGYKRITSYTAVGSLTGLKNVTVTVYWKSDARSVILRNTLAE
jgi:type IV pilus assembly protein PilV